MIFRYLLLSVLALSLSACGSVSPIPSDTFYRLDDNAANIAKSGRAWTDGGVMIERVRARGIYKDRAIAILKEDGVSLKQSKYHHWNDTPEVLIQHRLLEHAVASGISNKVSVKRDGQTEFIVGGRLLRFERLENYSGEPAVAVELALNVRRANVGGDTLFESKQSYVRATKSAEVHEAVRALSAGIDEIIANFFRDASSVLLSE
ncbi:MAG: hypothetical protein ACU84Q_18975 [Gammaproteobacteria bacterium]